MIATFIMTIVKLALSVAALPAITLGQLLILAVIVIIIAFVILYFLGF